MRKEFSYVRHVGFQHWGTSRPLKGAGEGISLSILMTDVLWPGCISRAGPVCRDLGTSVKRNKNQPCDFMTAGLQERSISGNSDKIARNCLVSTLNCIAR